MGNSPQLNLNEIHIPKPTLPFGIPKSSTDSFTLKKKKTPALEIIMLGLETAGKTTLMEQVSASESSDALPAVGSTVAVAKYTPKAQWLNKDHKKPRCAMKIRSWAVGKDTTGPEWRKYSQKGVNALIWVIDSTDKEKLTWNEDEEWEGTVRHEVYNSLAEPSLQNVPLLILVNKQDLPNALTLHEVSQRLEMAPGSKMPWTVFAKDCGFEMYLNEEEIIARIYEYLPGVPIDWKRELHFEGCCATSGDGLWEGLVWLEEAIERFEKCKTPTTAIELAFQQTT